MEKSNKRGKIPQSDWPLIMARYEAGETLASIARTYDCSPPAISYVVSRSRARQPAAPSPASINAAERTLVKADTAAGALRPQSAGAADRRNAAEPRRAPEPQRETPPVRSEPAGADRFLQRESDGSSRNGSGGERQVALPLSRDAHAPPRPALATGASGGDQRRTLHLSLGNGGHANGNGAHSSGAHANGAAHTQANGAHADPVPSAPLRHNGDRHNGERNNGGGDALRQQVAGDHGSPHPMRLPPGPDRNYDGAAQQGQLRHLEEAPRKEGGGSIDSDLRARIEGDIAAFLAAFDAALEKDSQESRSALREATDRLLRAGARTRIELERLEARVPLSRRDNGTPGEPAWRYR